MRFRDALSVLMSPSEKAAPKGRRMREAFVDVITGNQWSSPAPEKTADFLRLYRTNAHVRSIVGRIADAVAGAEWEIEDANGEEIENHPAIKWLKRGSKKLPGHLARRVTALHYDLAGEAFWAVGLDPKGVPVEYAPIPPHWVTEVPKTGAQNETYTVNPKNGTPYLIPASQIIWFRDVDPADPYDRGAATTRAIKLELDTDTAASEFLHAHFKNRARPDLIISGSKEAPLNERDRARAEETWLEKYRGWKNAGKPFFSSGALTVQTLGGNLRDQLMDDMRAAAASRIAEYYGVPPEVFGRIENSNRSTIDSADYLMAKWVIAPRLTAMREWLEPFVRENFGLADTEEFDFESPVEEDAAFALQVMQAQPTAFTRNEFRKLAKMKALDAPGFDEPIAPPPMLDPFGGPGSDGPTPPGGKDDPKDAPEGDKPPADPEGDKPTKGNPVAEAVKTASVSPVLEKQLSPDGIVQVADAHRDAQVTAEVTRLVEQMFRALLMTYGDELLGSLESDARFQINASVADWILTEVPQLISGIDETTRNALRATLVEGAAATESVAMLADRVEQVFAQAAETRAELIGTTTATQLAGYGSLEAAKQGGFTRKKWLSSADQIVRDSHRALDGQVRPTSQPFQSPTGAQAQYPGGFGEPAEDINCRCAMRPVLDGEDEKSLKSGDANFNVVWATAHARMTGRIARRFRDIFEAQKAVVLAELHRVGGLA